MLNDFQEKYYNQDKGAHIKSFNMLMDIKSDKPKSIIRATIPELDKNFKDAKPFSYSIKKEQIFNNYDTKKRQDTNQKEKNPYDFLFGFSKAIEPEDKPNRHITDSKDL